MMRSMFAAISGLKVHQTMLDVTANDIANVNTLGYKAAAHDVQGLALAAAARRRRRRTPAQGGSNAVQVGLGVQLGSIDNHMSTGALQTTGNPLDVAIQGDGAGSASANADPAAGAGSIANVQYTRAGNFTRNDAGLPRSPRTATTSSAASAAAAPAAPTS